MADGRPNGVTRRRRLWSFGACVFDEANWSLIVKGKRVSVETKPLELLRQLLLHSGQVLSKDELLAATWPNVTVVEASLPTAIRKLRLALGNDRIIQTVSGIGYRIAVPVKVEDRSVDPDPPTTMIRPATQADKQEVPGAAIIATGQKPAAIARLLSVGGSMAIGMAAISIAMTTSANDSATTASTTRAYTQRDAENALRKLDIGTIERMLAAGWDPNRPFDNQGNGAINYVLNICEWNRDHDQSQLLLMVRTLHDGGARLDHRNAWGDTAYSIAKAQRYCGPDHPVTRSIRTMCYAGYKPLGDRCLAAYEISRKQRRS
jgi:DNA-binding winged helix-turn-helix (wHTH) protein